MRCSRSLLCSAMPLLTILLFCGMPAFSQDPPGVAMGMNPQATYHGGDFDFVDMTTGRLNLHIPLVVDHSQRGKLNFTYSVTYTSPGTWSGVMSGTPYNPWYYIEPSKYGFSTPALVTDGSLSATAKTYHWPDEGIVKAWYAYEGGYGIGAMHPLGSLSGTNYTGIMESIDGSGIRFSNANSPSTLTNKEGIQFGSAIEDANGNEWTTTDTLGRTWTTSSGSTNVTGCPTGGPVAPTTSTIWTIPGPANSVRTFKFCYSVYNVHTNFNAPPYQEYTGGPGLMTGVVLPDGTTWRLDYDNNSYGDLIAIYPPTGGHISYTWTTTTDGCGGAQQAWDRIIASRTVFDGTNSNIWRYNWANGGFTVTGPTQPVGNDSVYAVVTCPPFLVQS